MLVAVFPEVPAYAWGALMTATNAVTIVLVRIVEVKPNERDWLRSARSFFTDTARKVETLGFIDFISICSCVL